MVNSDIYVMARHLDHSTAVVLLGWCVLLVLHDHDHGRDDGDDGDDVHIHRLLLSDTRYQNV